jgi:hypothetical protein
MKKMTFPALLTLFLILSIAVLAEAGTARFPVEVKWNASGRGQVNTEIYLINLKGTPVSVSLTLYEKGGTKLGCSVMPTITIPANGTQIISPSGCFAIAVGVPLDFEGIGQIDASSNTIGIYWRIYDVTVSPPELIDQGKELPTGGSPRIFP